MAQNVPSSDEWHEIIYEGDAINLKNAKGETIAKSFGKGAAWVKIEEDLNIHPLAPFFLKVIKEYEEGKDKYGEWVNLSETDQKDAVKSEILEVLAAMLKKDKGAKELIELPQLANVTGKRYIEILRKGES